MRKLALAFSVAALPLAACNSVDVAVTPSGAGSGAAPLSQAQVRTPVATPGGDSSGMLVFERVSLDGGSPARETGVGFISARAEAGAAPFGVLTDSPFALGEGALAGFGGGQLFTLSAAADGGATQLLAVDPATLDRREVLVFPRSPASLVVLTDGGAFAWSDSRGGAYVQASGSAPGSAPTPLDADQTFALRVRPQAGLVALTARTAAGATVTYLYTAAGARVAGPIASAELAVSPDGGRVAYAAEDSAGARVALETLPGSQPDGIAVSGAGISELSWGDAGVLAYRAVRADGVQELRALDLASRAETVVSSLGISPQDAARALCPAWAGGELYFSDRVDGRFVIRRASRADGSWAVETFVAPGDSEEGFICPQVGGLSR